MACKFICFFSATILGKVKFVLYRVLMNGKNIVVCHKRGTNKKKIACSMIDFNFYYNDSIFVHFLSSLVTCIILCSYTRQ